MPTTHELLPHRPGSWGGKFSVAWAGIHRSWMSQSSLKVQSMAAVSVVGMAAWTGLSTVEWAILSLTIGMVLGLELVNTALEAAVDLVTGEYAELAKVAKDAAAGAVLVASLSAIAVAGCLFVPRWLTSI